MGRALDLGVEHFQTQQTQVFALAALVLLLLRSFIDESTYFA
jgi:hypothetical protein